MVLKDTKIGTLNASEFVADGNSNQSSKKMLPPEKKIGTVVTESALVHPSTVDMDLPSADPPSTSLGDHPAPADPPSTPLGDAPTVADPEFSFGGLDDVQ